MGNLFSNISNDAQAMPYVLGGAAVGILGANYYEGVSVFSIPENASGFFRVGLGGVVGGFVGNEVYKIKNSS